MNQVPNSLKKMLWKGDIHALTDTFKMILMQSGFVFNKDNHHCYADISASELPTAFGYTVGGQTLTGVSLVVNNTLDRAELTWSPHQWDAVGGALVASGAIIFDDTTATGSGHDYTDAIASYIDFGGTRTVLDGTPLRVEGLAEFTE